MVDRRTAFISASHAMYFHLASVTCTLALLLFAVNCEVDDLLDLLQSHGAKIQVQVTTSPHGAGRGLLATKFIKEGEVIVQLPANQALFIGAGKDTSPEMAISLLREKHRLTRNHFDVYLTTLPRPEDLFIAEMMPDSLLPWLQSDELEELVLTKRKWAHDVWSGEAKIVFPLKRAVTKSNVTWEEFLWATAVVTTRSIGMSNGRRFLIPIIDMANHHPAANHSLVHGFVDGKMSFQLVAAHDIQADEEVFINYGTLRNDEALLYYGFLLPEDPPQLCAVDCQGYDPNEQPGKNVFEQVTGPVEAVTEEYRRLKAILDNLPRESTMTCTVGDADFGPGDCGTENDVFASLLWRFQELRRSALEYELKRLESLLQVYK